MRVQIKRSRANEMGGRGSVMFEYVDFLHFNFRGINLSHLRHYYQGLRAQCNNDTELFVSCLPVYLIKQTSLEEPSWMSLYLESIGVVRGDPCEIRESFFRHC